jgi:hypothetical protein
VFMGVIRVCEDLPDGNGSAADARGQHRCLSADAAHQEPGEVQAISAAVSEGTAGGVSQEEVHQSQ